RMGALVGEEDAYSEHFESFTAVNVADWLLWHDGNPSAVVSCVTTARENARSLREQLSGDVGGDQRPVPPRREDEPTRGVTRPARILRAGPQRHAPLPGLRGGDDDAR